MSIIAFDMSDISSIRDLINLWPRRADLAAAMNGVAGFDMVSVAQVHKWAEKNAVPARYHSTLVKAGVVGGYQVTADLVVDLHDLRGRAA